MTKAQIVEEIVQKTGLTKKDVADSVDHFLKAISEALATGRHLEIRGFGPVKERAVVRYREQLRERVERLRRPPAATEAAA